MKDFNTIFQIEANKYNLEPSKFQLFLFPYLFLLLPIIIGFHTKISLDASASGDQRCQDPLYSLQRCKLYMCLVQS